MKRRMTKSIASLIIVAAMVSCSQEITSDLVSQKPASDEVTKLSASIGNFKSETIGEEVTPLTRSTIVEDINGDLQLVWSDKDTLGIFSSSGFQVPFPLTGQVGEKSATFDGGGWGLKVDGTYSAYTPLIGNLYLKKTEIPLILLTQVQNGNGSFEHLNKYDYMAAVNATVNQSGGVDFNFEHLVAILHMKIKMPKGGAYKYVILETSDKFTTEAKLDLSDGSVTSTKQSPIQAMKLENVNVTESEDGYVLEIYMSILPADLTNKVLYTKIYDEDNNCYSTTMQAKNFAAGTIYNSKKIAVADLTHSGLPVTIINTPNNQDITSKESYVENTVISVFQTDVIDEFCELSTNVKGRGNTTWLADKKPYAIKFNSKKSLMGLPKDKSWVLLANYFDPTLLHNDFVLWLGNKYSCLDWTPHYKQVDLVLNGQYKGIYQLGEKVKISADRVDVGDDGFLLEVDGYAPYETGSKYFSIAHLEQVVNFKDPDADKVSDEDFNYVKGYFEDADAALFSNDFKDPVIGWKAYLDMDSFVDWYLINEIAKNGDAFFWSSTYMNFRRGGKIKMGPLWDYDLAFGSYFNEPIASKVREPEGFYLKNAKWYTRLFEDEAFVEKVVERFNVYYGHKQDMLDHIDAQTDILINKVVEDNKLWGTITTDKESTIDEVKSAYQEKVDAFKSWLSTRLDWLNTNINNLLSE